MRTRKRNRAPTGKKHHDEGTWAISYGDMITLLLGFFILFFSIEPPQKGNVMLNESLIERMKKLDQDMTLTVDAQSGKKEEISSKGNDENNKEQALTFGKLDDAQAGFIRNDKDNEEVNLGSTEGPFSGDGTDTEKYSTGLFSSIWKVFFGGRQDPYKENEQKTASDAREFDRMALAAKAPITNSELSNRLSNGDAKKAEDGGVRKNIIKLDALNAEAETVNDKVIIKFPNVSFFGTASTELTNEAITTIEKFADVYMPFAGKSKLNIIGFSDSRPVKSGYRFKDNLELSVLRAVSVQRNLAKIGIPINKTRLAGYGVNEKLLDQEKPTSKSEALALSRKIVLVIEPSGE